MDKRIGRIKTLFDEALPPLNKLMSSLLLTMLARVAENKAKTMVFLSPFQTCLFLCSPFILMLSYCLYLDDLLFFGFAIRSVDFETQS